MMDYKNLEEKTLSRKDIFKGRIIDVHVDEVELPNGNRSFREVVDHVDGVAVLALDADNNVMMVTQYRYVFGRTLLEIRLETGRTHQIRVHFSHLGHPLCGDFMYGQEIEQMKGCALHSCAITLTQPTTGQALAFTADDPPVFAKLLEGLL